MTDVSIIGLCRNDTELQYFEFVVAQTGIPGFLLDIDGISRSLSRSVQTLSLKYPPQSPDIDERIWQLPHICPTPRGVYLDFSKFCIPSIKSLVAQIDADHVVVSAPQYQSTGFAESNLPHAGDWLIAFDKHPDSFKFFDTIREIGRNWATISITSTAPSLRKKQFDTEIGIAYRATFPDRSGMFVVSGAVPTPVDVVNQTAIHKGRIVNATTLDWVLF